MSKGSQLNLHESSLVHADRGLIPADAVRAGDGVYCLDERTKEILTSRVTAVSRVEGVELYEMKVGTRSITIDGSCALLALVDRRKPGRRRRRFRAEWVTISDLRAGDIVGVARKTPDVGTVQRLRLPARVRDRRARTVTLPEVANYDLLWWLGLYAGDGYLHHAGKTRRVEFAIPESQPDLREELIATTMRLFGVIARAQDAWRVVVPGVRLADYIESVGLSGGALEKRIPTWVFSSPEEHRLAFLGGYVDADGMIRTPSGANKNKDMGLTSGNGALLEDARRLAVTCGIRVSTIWDFTSRHPYHVERAITGYRMQFSGDFDKVRCRSLRRKERMNKRKWFHKDISVGGTTLRSHASEWLGFAAIDRVGAVPCGRATAVVTAADNLVVERLIVRGNGPFSGQ